MGEAAGRERLLRIIGALGGIGLTIVMGELRDFCKLARPTSGDWPARLKPRPIARHDGR